MPDDLDKELALLRRLILDAGRTLRQAARRFGSVSYKSATELVTDLDRRLESQLVTDLQAAFPADAVMAEEGAQRAGSSGRTWLIDPLDGTTNFVHGYPIYSISVGCAHGDELLLGAVFAPYLDELYLAARGRGAFLERPGLGDAVRLPPRAPVSLESSLLATGFPYVRDEIVALNCDYLQRFLMAPCHGVRRGGSAAVDLCHVAAAKLDGYWEMRLRPWDVAAGTLIAREAGALVTDFSRKAGLLSGKSVVAAAPKLHGQMLAILKEGRHGTL